MRDRPQLGWRRLGFLETKSHKRAWKEADKNKWRSERNGTRSKDQLEQDREGQRMYFQNIKGSWVWWLSKPRALGAPGHHREQHVCLYGYGGAAHQRNPAGICIYTNLKEQASLRWAARRCLTRWTKASSELRARDPCEAVANHDAWHLQPHADWARLLRWWSIWPQKEEPKEVVKTRKNQ